MSDDSPRPPPAVIIPLLGIVAAGSAAWLGILLGFAPPPGSDARPPVLAELPDFALVASDGRPFTRKSLIGSAWIADFVFTRCGDSCPMMTERMRALQADFERRGLRDVRLLTVTVDPDHDTPEVLAEYGRERGATDRWVFATGDKAAIHALCEGFLVGAPQQLAEHSIRLMLVDRRGRLRGHYDVVRRAGLEDESAKVTAKMLADLDMVRAEPDLSLILPAVNAALNTLAAVLLGAGFVFIRTGRVSAHRNCMLAAFAVSSAFLANYVYYHLNFPARPFAGQGAIRVVYLSILFSHIALAFAIVPMALTALVLAFRGKFELHRRIARRTFPIWVYVSITGFVIYWMLYRLPVDGRPG